MLIILINSYKYKADYSMIIADYSAIWLVNCLAINNLWPCYLKPSATKIMAIPRSNAHAMMSVSSAASCSPPIPQMYCLYCLFTLPMYCIVYCLKYVYNVLFVLFVLFVYVCIVCLHHPFPKCIVCLHMYHPFPKCKQNNTFGEWFTTHSPNVLFCLHTYF